MIELIYFIIGLIATLIGSLAGLGGGIIIKPMLDLLGHFDVATITILSAATVFAMSIVSLTNYIKLDVKINIRTSLYIALGSIIGGLFGKLLFNVLISNLSSIKLLGSLQSLLIFILMIIIYFLVKQRSKFPIYQVKNAFIIFVFGMGLGLLAAFLGIGGGPLNVALLAIAFSMQVKEAALNSVFIIFFSQLASLSFSAFSNGFSNVNSTILVIMIVSGMIGGFIGSRIAKMVTNKTVEIVFHFSIWFVIVISGINAAKYLLG